MGYPRTTIVALVAALAPCMPLFGGALPGQVAPVEAAAGARDPNQDDSPAEPAWRPRLLVRRGHGIDLSQAGFQGKIDLVPRRGAVENPPRERALMSFESLQVLPLAPIGIRRAPDRVLRPFDDPGATVLAPSQDDSPLVGVGAEYAILPKPPEGEEADGSWAYVRVVDVSTDFIWVELAVATADHDRMVRDPVDLQVTSERGGAAIRWTSGEVLPAPGESEVAVAVPRSYAVHRRPAGTRDWEPLGVVAGTTFTDTSVGARSAVYEYSVVRAAEGGRSAPGVLGSAVVALVGRGAGQDRIVVAPGSRVDLLAAELATSSAGAHVEVGRSSPGSLALQPREGTRFVRARASKSGATDPSWWLPPALHGLFVPNQTIVLRDGVEAVFALPGGVVGRLTAFELGPDRWELERRFALAGHRLLPRSPADAPEIVGTAEGAPVLSVPTVSKAAGIDPETVRVIVEVERPYGSSVWEPIGEVAGTTARITTPGVFERVALDAVGSTESIAPVARVRASYETSTGDRSSPGAARELLAVDAVPERRDEHLAEALAKIDSADFQARLESRAVLRLMGDDARPGLEAIVVGDGGPRAEAARELLVLIERGDDRLARLAEERRAHALESLRSDPRVTGDPDEWLGPTPKLLADASPSVRAAALLRIVDRAERGVLSAKRGDLRDDAARASAWIRSVAAGDRDEGVRALAEFLVDLGLNPSMASLDPSSSAWVMAPDQRSADESIAIRWAELPASGADLAWAIEARPELVDLELGPPLARLLAVLRSPGQFQTNTPMEESSDVRFFDYDARTAELVLRLVERARGFPERSPRRRALIEGANAVLSGEALLLKAWRHVGDRRLGTWAPDAPNAAESAAERRRVVLESADLSLLEAALTELAELNPAVRSPESAGVDLCLPSGTYGSAEGTAPLLVVRTNGLRLLPADPGGEVTLHAGLRVSGAEDVVIERITVRSATGQAISALDGAHVVAVGARLFGAGTVVHAQGGTIELVECDVLPADPAKPPSTAVRLIVGGTLYARTTRFAAGTMFVSSDAAAWLDRCVIDSGIRTLVQSQDGGRLVARETLMRGEAMGLFRVTEGLLAAVVLDVPREPLGRTQRPVGGGGLKVSPTRFRLIQGGASVPSWMRLDHAPLGGR